MYSSVGLQPDTLPQKSQSRRVETRPARVSCARSKWRKLVCLRSTGPAGGALRPRCV